MYRTCVHCNALEDDDHLLGCPWYGMGTVQGLNGEPSKAQIARYEFEQLRNSIPQRAELVLPPIIRTGHFTKISLDKKNRMLRAGFGLHDGKWFFRVDLWFVGFRIS